MANAKARRLRPDSRATGGARRSAREAAQQLDAVAFETERATTTIIATAERIEAAARLMCAPGARGRQSGVGAILAGVVELYEACHFQDIAGQRITKVLASLNSRDGAPSRRAPHGPSMTGRSVSQREVDTLFG